jgi:hypothetical protein
MARLSLGLLVVSLLTSSALGQSRLAIEDYESESTGIRAAIASADPATHPASDIELMQATQPAPSASGDGAAGAGGGGDAPDPGTDPSKAKRRFLFYHEYFNIQGTDNNFNTTTVAAILPILGGGGTFGVFVPFTYAEIPQPRANPFGLGDVYGRMILMPSTWDEFKGDWPFQKVIPIIGTDIYLPTADSTLVINPYASRVLSVSLGTRKYRLAPLVGFAWQVSERWSVIPVYFQDMSVAGDPTAKNINQGKLRLFVQYQDPSGWYFKPEFQVVTYYNDDNRTEIYVAPEVGKVFKGGSTFYIKPGYGFLRQDYNRNWGIEFGLRTLF